MWRATSLIHTSEIKILLNLPSIILVLMFVNVKTLIMLISYLEQARERPTCSLQATWCPRGPPWWPWSCWNKFIAAIHAPTTFRIGFLHSLLLFWGQYCCWTETSILVNNFLFFISLHFPQYFYWHLPYRWFGCYLCFMWFPL